MTSGQAAVSVPAGFIAGKTGSHEVVAAMVSQSEKGGRRTGGRGRKPRHIEWLSSPSPQPRYIEWIKPQLSGVPDQNVVRNPTSTLRPGAGAISRRIELA